jgi:hypothetical protein
MTSHSDVQGEGFEIVGDEEQKTAEEPEGGEPAAEESSEPKGEEVKGEGFEILDHEEPEPRAEEAGPGAGEPAGAEEQMRVDVYSVLRVSIAQLAGVAWQMMGLQADPFTNKVQKDAAQARVAIDAAAALVEQLKPHLQGQEVRDFQSLLTDLRMNFVTHLGGEQPKT